MNSSFVRRGPKVRTDSGTRPGLHEQTLISSGLADFDKLLGGGLPLGTVLLILEDTCSRQHVNFIRYFLAEGVACGQSVAWLGGHLPPGGLERHLPKISTKSTEPQEKEISDNKKEGKLRIAWQYKRYLKQDEGSMSIPHSGMSSSTRLPVKKKGVQSRSASGVALNWCHNFDLTKQMGEEALSNCPKKLYEEVCGSEFATKACEFIQQHAIKEEKIKGVPERKVVGRLAIQSLKPTTSFNPSTPEYSESDIIHTIFSIKSAIRNTHCCALITCPPSFISQSTLTRLQHLTDGLIQLEALSDDSEIMRYVSDPASCSCLLHLGKIPIVGGVYGCKFENSLYVVRHKRKRIGVELVEVDPDAELNENEAAGQWEKSTTSVLCGGPVNKESKLDF